MSGQNTYTIVISDEGANDFIRQFGNEENFGSSEPPWVYVALGLADAIRANPPKPPRMDEPGLWGVVEANWHSQGITGLPRAEWIRVNGNLWHSAIAGVVVPWSELIDPVLVREGVDA